MKIKQCAATAKSAKRYHRGGKLAKCQRKAASGSKYCSIHKNCR